jgi:hypothetical protein
MASVESNSPDSPRAPGAETQHTLAAGNGPSTRGRWATANAIWQMQVADLPEQARPFFADPPSANIVDFQHYMNLVKLALAQTEHCDLFVALRARDFVEIVWRQHTLRRCEQATIESEMRPAARALLRELLDDGQRSAQELDSLVVRCTHLALNGGPSGLDEVRKLAPLFDLEAVEAEAIRRSLEMTETLSKMQALLEAQKEKAIGHLQYAVESAEDDHRPLTDLPPRSSATDKKGSKPQQVKQ